MTAKILFVVLAAAWVVLFAQLCRRHPNKRRRGRSTTGGDPVGRVIKEE